MGTVKCLECGAEFSKKGKKLYCSYKCQQKYWKGKRKKTIKSVSFKNEISRINSLAINENLTYGKYVAKYGI